MALLAHLDLDAFFASVELRANPSLKGKPVVVAGRGPRSVVTTASYEARKFGVGSAMSAQKARALCPDATFISPDIASYRKASREVMGIVSSRFSRVEQLGLDEAFLDLSGIENPVASVRALQSEILIETEISASVGVGENRLLAKMASDVQKPFGLTELDRLSACEMFGSSSPRVIPGIGPRTEQALLRAGIHTVEELARFPVPALQGIFGPRKGQEIHDLSMFQSSDQIVTRREAKSESREQTFPEDIEDIEGMRLELSRLASRLCEDLTRSGHKGRTVRLKVRLSDWTTVTRARTLPFRTSSEDVVFEVAASLLEEYDPKIPVRLLGVGVSGFEEDSPRQLRLPLPEWVLDPSSEYLKALRG